MFSKKDGLDPRVQALEHSVSQLQKDSDKMDRALEKLEQIYVRTEEFTPIKNVIYGLVGIVLMGALGAVMATIGLG